VLAELRGDGVPDELLARIDVPAGFDIGARTPAEIALSILARIIALRNGGAAPVHRGDVLADAGEPATGWQRLAVDPICGMTVAAVAGTPSLTRGGETIYFCCDGCRSTYEAQHGHAGLAD
jgi:xanthine dehydrogenase accessory factor